MRPRCDEFADVNSDGTVSAIDLIEVLKAYGVAEQCGLAADTNFDCVVDERDKDTVKNARGSFDCTGAMNNHLCWWYGEDMAWCNGQACPSDCGSIRMENAVTCADAIAQDSSLLELLPRCATPTTRTILRHNGPNHLGLWYRVLPSASNGPDHHGLCALQAHRADQPRG